MATATDKTTFRMTDEYGQTVHEHTTTSQHFTMLDFEQYVEQHGISGGYADWYVVDTEENCAQWSDGYGITTYPTASLFA